MRIKMLQDAPGSPNGTTVLEYEEGNVYEVPEALADVFIAEGDAEETTENVTGVEPEDIPEDEDAEDESKKLSGPKENK